MEDNLYSLTTFGHNYTLANVFIILNIQLLNMKPVL